MFEPAWWQRGAVYQISPRSFADTVHVGVWNNPTSTEYISAVRYHR
jgi:hypothetical protein